MRYYTKIIQGFVEIVYDEHGNPLEVEFVINPSQPVDRRAIRDDISDPRTVPEGQLGPEELIADPDDIQYLESREKHCELAMVQPPPVVKPRG